MKKTMTIMAALAMGAGVYHQTVRAEDYPADIKGFVPTHIIVTAEGETIRLSTDTTGIKDVLLTPAPAGATNTVDWGDGTNPQTFDIDLKHTAIIKDGAGELIIDEDLDMSQCFVAREGKTTISNANVTNTVNSKGSASLSVAGKDAELVLDHATYTDVWASDASHTRGVLVGGTDGDGALTLTNGSKITTQKDGYLILGHSSWPSAKHDLFQPQADLIVNSGTYKDASGTGDENRYRDQANFEDKFVGSSYVEDVGMYNATGHLTIEGGSQVQVGRVWALNGEITISGEGSLLADSNAGDQNYFGESFANDAGNSVTKVTVNIEDGGKLSLSQMTSLAAWSGESSINVSGAGSEIEVKNFLTAVYHGPGDTLQKKVAEIKVTDGGKATVSYLWMGYEEDNGSESHGLVYVDETSSYSGSSLMLNGATTEFRNAGTTEFKTMELIGYEDQAPSIRIDNASTFLNEATGNIGITKGDVNSDVQVKNGSQLINNGNIDSEIGIFDIGSTISGTGTFEAPYISLMEGGKLYAGDQETESGSMTIKGVLELNGDSTVYSYGEGGSLDVEGSISVYGSNETVVGDLTMDSGSVLGTATDSRLTVEGSLSVAGRVQNDGEIALSGEEGLTVTNGGMISGNGTYNGDVAVQTGGAVVALAGETTTFTGNLTVAGMVLNSGEIAVSGEDGLTVTDGGVITGSGTYNGNVAVETGGGVATLSGATTTFTGDLTVAGTVRNDGEIVLEGTEGLTVTDGGVITGNGTYDGDVAVQTGGAVVAHEGETTTFTGNLTVAGTVQNDGTIAVSGTDGLTVTEGGVITGNGTYNGDVAVQTGGAVVASAGETTTFTGNLTVAGTVQNDGEIVLEEGLAVTNGGVMTGGGTYDGDVTVEMGGTIVANAGETTTITGKLTVDGTVQNEGTISASEVTVLDGAVLGGTGTFDAEVKLSDGATLVIGSPTGGISGLVIDGNLSLERGSTIKSYVPISPIVTGTMDVSPDGDIGKKVTVDMTDALLMPGRSYSFDYGVEEEEINLVAQKGVTYRYDDETRPTEFRIDTSDMKVPDIVTQALAQQSFNGSTGSALMEAIYDSRDLYNTAAGGADQAQSVADLLPSDAAKALWTADQLAYAGQGAERDRLLSAISGASATSLGLAYSDDMQRQMREIRNRAVSNSYTMKSPQQGTVYAWVQAEGNFRDLENSGTDAGYKLDSWGGTVGAGMLAAENLQVGLAVTAMSGNIDSHASDSARGDLDTYYLSAFATYQSSAWSHYLGIMGSLANASFDRTVAHANGSYVTHGSTDGIGFGIMYELGYTFKLDEDKLNSITPILNVTYAHTRIDGYTESGSDLAMRFGDQSMDTFTLGAGVRSAADIGARVLNRSAILEGRALAKVDVGDRRCSTSVTTAMPLPYSGAIRSAEASAFGVELGVGLTVPVGPLDGAVFIDGSVELRGDYSNWNMTAGYRISF